jgi:23S rRNA (pseudouridine1915-N3)-methyltransferase
MRTLVVAVGAHMPPWVAAGFDEYIRRMPREARVELVEIKPQKRSPGWTTDRVLLREAQRIEAALPQACTRVALDERGKMLNSAELARQIAAWRLRGKDIAFLIGGADGLAAGLKSTVAATLSLSAMTLPHGLARVLLAEQLYRAHTISTGHPYHRE